MEVERLSDIVVVVKWPDENWAEITHNWAWKYWEGPLTLLDEAIAKLRTDNPYIF